jgi:hypothetical protein
VNPKDIKMDPNNLAARAFMKVDQRLNLIINKLNKLAYDQQTLTYKCERMNTRIQELTETVDRQQDLILETSENTKKIQHQTTAIRQFLDMSNEEPWNTDDWDEPSDTQIPTLAKIIRKELEQQARKEKSQMVEDQQVNQ